MRVQGQEELGGGVLVGLECRTWQGEWQKRRTGGSA